MPVDNFDPVLSPGEERVLWTDADHDLVEACEFMFEEFVEVHGGILQGLGVPGTVGRGCPGSGGKERRAGRDSSLAVWESNPKTPRLFHR